MNNFLKFENAFSSSRQGIHVKRSMITALKPYSFLNDFTAFYKNVFLFTCLLQIKGSQCCTLLILGMQ